MLNHAAKAIARTDKHAAALSDGFGFSTDRDGKTIDTLIEGASMRIAVSMLKRMGVKPDEVNVLAAVTLTHRNAMQLLQATVLDMPSSVQQYLMGEMVETREGVRRTVARPMAKRVNETVYQQIIADWPADIVLPTELLRNCLGINKPPAAPGAALADAAMEQTRREGRFMMAKTAALLDGRMVRNDRELLGQYIDNMAGLMLRDTVLSVAAELKPQQPLSNNAVDALTLAYGATLMTGQYMTQHSDNAEAAGKLAEVMKATGDQLPHLDGMDYVTRLHFATAFAERALVDLVDVDGGHKQLMQAAMLTMGLDPHLDDGAPAPPDSPPPAAARQKPIDKKLN